jgi:glycosyltransferase
MKVSIITAVLNARETIRETIESILEQTFGSIEYIIVDGGSTDGTLEVIEEFSDSRTQIISEPDHGLYDALNKGIKVSSGDIIGILHAGDLYAHKQVLKTVAEVFEDIKEDSCYGDLQYVDPDDPNKVIRYWKSSAYKDGIFGRGWMPPHPTFFVKRAIYEKYKAFNPQFRISGDYELMLRYLAVHRISTHYIPEVMVKMRVGGMSNRNLRYIIRKSYEDYKACRLNHLHGGWVAILLKNLIKLRQFLKK